MHMPPRVAAFIQTRLLPSLPPVLTKTLTTPTIHLGPHHLLPTAAALALVVLWTARSWVPERWAKHGVRPAWADSHGDEEGGVRGEGRTLEGEVARLLRGQASMGEAFEVRFRGLGPVLRRRQAAWRMAGAGRGEAVGGVRRGL